MHTVADILAAAATVSGDELRELAQQLTKLERRSRRIELQPRGMPCQLVRLDDAEFIALSRRSIAIEEDYGFYWSLFLNARRDDMQLNLAQVYLALKHLSGESGEYIDDWKGSFSFPFALDVIKNQREFAYLLDVRNHRGSLEFVVRKIVPP